MRCLATSGVLAIVLLGTASAPVFAECMNFPLPPTARPNVAFAFTGTVTDIVETPYPNDNGEGLSRFRVTVDLGRQYRGRVPEPLELKGLNFGCSFFRIAGLTEGDRLFVASERFETGGDETWFENVLVWRRAGDRWVFYEEVLQGGSDTEYYSKAARTASTTADILALIGLPDTSTQPSRDEPAVPAAIPGLAILFLVSFGLAIRRTELRKRL